MTEPVTILAGPRATGTGFDRRSSKTRVGRFTASGPRTGSRVGTRRSSVLLKKIDDLLDSDPDYRKELERAQRVTSLRQQLIDLREKEIQPSFPDASQASGLLRQVLLDEFVRRRPRTKEDWFKFIPYELRSQTDSKQVGQYLSRVLNIIPFSSE